MSPQSMDEMAEVRNRLKELAEFLSNTAILGGQWYFPEYGYVLAFGRGAGEADARLTAAKYLSEKT